MLKRWVKSWLVNSVGLATREELLVIQALGLRSNQKMADLLATSREHFESAQEVLEIHDRLLKKLALKAALDDVEKLECDSSSASS